MNRKVRQIVISYINWIELFGFAGSISSSITFVPQVYEAWHLKNVRDLSLSMLTIVLASIIFWLVYAMALTLWPVILANSVILILSIVLLIFKFTFE